MNFLRVHGTMCSCARCVGGMAVCLFPLKSKSPCESFSLALLAVVGSFIGTMAVVVIVFALEHGAPCGA